MYRDLSRCHDWSVEKAIVNLPMNQSDRKFETHFNLESLGGSGTRISAVLRRRY